MKVASPWRNLGDAVLRDGTAERIALIDLGGETAPRPYTYTALDRLCNAVARGLLRRGLRAGDRVAILAANRAEHLAVFLGALRAGIVAVPVNYKLPAVTVGFVLADSGAKVVFADAARLALCPPDLPSIQFGTPAFDALLDDGPFTAVDMLPAAPAMFLYTSGSTGRPKGVVLSHWSHLWVIAARTRRPAPPGQRMLVAAPLYHMNALAMCQVTFAQGDTIVLLPSFTAAGYIDAIGAHRVNVLTSVPTMIAMMLRERDLLARTDLSSVEVVRMASAPLTQGLIDQVRGLFPKAAITNGYGTTEAGPIVFGPHPQGVRQPELSVGYPNPHVELRLTAAGELEMKCPAVMNGYHNLPKATAKAMTTDGFYRTGDVFRRDADGFFYFVGRADDMFVSGGENIYPGEVEKMLERHPAVHQAAVIPLPDELKGHKPVAFIVVKPGAVLDEPTVKSYALEHAPAYQHPRRVWFLEEMPLAGTNKVDKRALAALAEKGPA